MANSPEPSWKLESAKQLTSPGKPKADEDDNLKQVEPIPGTFKNFACPQYPVTRRDAASQLLLDREWVISSIIVRIVSYIIFSYSVTR